MPLLAECGGQKMLAPITISITSSCSPHEITPRSIKLSLKSDKVDISQYGGSCKPRNETETKRNKTKRNETKYAQICKIRNETK